MGVKIKRYYMWKGVRIVIFFFSKFGLVIKVTTQRELLNLVLPWRLVSDTWLIILLTN